jgi:hypothetical protein
MCESTSDCDSANGEICDDGICWGNPPAGQFAAIVSPPASRTNLASREHQKIAINPDGWIDQLQLEKPLTYSASLGCQAPIVCDQGVNATITVTRPSTFPGGPGFRSVIKAEGTKQFTIAVPPSHDYDLAATYNITIVPDGRDEMTGTTLAQIVPPLRTQLTIEGNATGKIIELGGLGQPTISGVIKNDSNQPQSSYRVVAIGRWDYNSAPTEVSTVDFTGTDGTFQIQLSGGLVPEIELVARPVGTNVTRPTLRYEGTVAQTGLQNLNLVWPPNVGGKLDLDVPVKEVDTNGMVKPARGARVIVSSKVTSPNGDATYVVEATTDDGGRARFSVLDGAAFTEAGYRISIIPQANSIAGFIYDQPFGIVSPIPERQLKTRVALRGIVRLDGEGIKDMQVTARPSLRFVWSLDDDPQKFLAAIPPSVATTPESGEFVVWVDPNLVNIWGYYDLVVEGTGAMAPNVTIRGIEMPRMSAAASVQLGIYDLPAPAYVRSKIVDDKGNFLEGAELKMFQTEDYSSLCREVANPPMNCMTSATTSFLVGRGSSDEGGEVRLTLPRAPLGE